MKVSKSSDFVDFDKTDPTRWIRGVDSDLSNIVTALQGRIRFGPNNSTMNKGENILGQFITYTTNGTPNTQDMVVHNLGSTPVGYLVVNKNKAGDIYTGATADSSNIYLKCSVASVTVVLFLLQ